MRNIFYVELWYHFSGEKRRKASEKDNNINNNNSSKTNKKEMKAGRKKEWNADKKINKKERNENRGKTATTKQRTRKNQRKRNKGRKNELTAKRNWTRGKYLGWDVRGGRSIPSSVPTSDALLPRLSTRHPYLSPHPRLIPQLGPAARGPQEETSDRWWADNRRRHRTAVGSLWQCSLMSVLIQHTQDITY